MSFLLAITWHSYTNANGVYDAVVSGDTFYLATGGGLVAFLPSEQKVLWKRTNLDGLPGVALTGLARDASGLFWVAVYGRGLAYGNESFEKYPILSLPFHDPNSVLYARGVDAVGNQVFVSTAEGLLLLDTKGTPDPSDDGSRMVLEVPTNRVEFKGDTLYACTDSGLYRVPLDRVLDPNAWERLYSARPVYSVLLGDTFLLGTDDGVRDTADRLLAADSAAVNWLLERDGKVYAATEGAGVWVLDVIAHPMGDTSFRGHKVAKVLLNGPRWLWAGFIWWPGSSEPQTFTYGLAWWDEGRSVWCRVRLGDLDFGIIRTLALMPNGNVVVSTTQPAQYPTSGNVFDYRKGRWKPCGLRHATSIKVFPEGKVFAGTWGQGLYQLDWWGNPVAQWGVKEGLNPPNVSCIGSTRQGEPLVGVFEFEGAVYRITTWGEVAGYPGISTGSSPNAVEEGPWGGIWVATGDGLYEFGSSGGRWALKETFLQGKAVYALEREPLKGLWIGAEDGLYFYDGEEVRGVYTGVQVKAFEQEPGGAFWLWGEDGLFRVSEEGELLASYIPGSSPLVGDADSPEIFSPIQDALALDVANRRLFVGTDAGVSVLEGLDITGTWKDELKVFPNPLHLSQTHTFRVQGAPPRAKLVLYTLDGLLVARGEAPYITLPDDVAPGLYLLGVRSDEGSAVRKVLVLP